MIPEVSGIADDRALHVDIHDGTVADVPLANLRQAVMDAFDLLISAMKVTTK